MKAYWTHLTSQKESTIRKTSSAASRFDRKLIHMLLRLSSTWMTHSRRCVGRCRIDTRVAADRVAMLRKVASSTPASLDPWHLFRWYRVFKYHALFPITILSRLSATRQNLFDYVFLSHPLNKLSYDCVGRLVLVLPAQQSNDESSLIRLLQIPRVDIRQELA